MKKAKTSRVKLRPNILLFSLKIFFSKLCSNFAKKALKFFPSTLKNWPSYFNSGQQIQKRPNGNTGRSGPKLKFANKEEKEERNFFSRFDYINFVQRFK